MSRTWNQILNAMSVPTLIHENGYANFNNKNLLRSIIRAKGSRRPIRWIVSLELGYESCWWPETRTKTAKNWKKKTKARLRTSRGNVYLMKVSDSLWRVTGEQPPVVYRSYFCCEIPPNISTSSAKSLHLPLSTSWPGSIQWYFWLCIRLQRNCGFDSVSESQPSLSKDSGVN